MHVMCMATATAPAPYDPYCRRPAAEIPEVALDAADAGLTPEAFAREDGTYNPETGEFACLGCYLDLGMPSAPGGGWKAGTTVSAIRPVPSSAP